MEPPKYSNRGLVESRHRSRAKIPRIQVFGAGAGANGVGPFFPELELEPEPSGHYIYLKSEPEPGPGCITGSGAGAVQDFPDSASLVSVMQCHPYGLEYSWPLGARLAARRPPGQSVLSAHFWLLAQSVRLGERMAQWMLSSGVRIRAFRACLVLGNCDARTITQKKTPIV